MAINKDAFHSSGDLKRELERAHERIDALENALTLRSASIGAGGLSVKGGAIVIYDESGSEQMRLSTDGLTLAGLLQIFGSLRLQSGSIAILDVEGATIFQAGPTGLTLDGTLLVTGSGTVAVSDDSNQAQVRMGLLESNGEFGLEQLVGSVFVPLAALAGGAEPGIAAAEGTLTESAGSSTSYTDTLDDPGGGTLPTGPSVTFTTYTGKWLILIVAHAGVSTDTAARMSYSASGAQSVSADDARSSLVTDPSTAMGIAGSAVYANVHTGAPGEITVTAEYRCVPPPSSPPVNGVASWQNRALIVIPY